MTNISGPNSCSMERCVSMLSIFYNIGQYRLVVRRVTAVEIDLSVTVRGKVAGSMIYDL